MSKMKFYSAITIPRYLVSCRFLLFFIILAFPVLTFSTTVDSSSNVHRDDAISLEEVLGEKAISFTCESDVDFPIFLYMELDDSLFPASIVNIDASSIFVIPKRISFFFLDIPPPVISLS